MAYQRCPICDGRGWMYAHFYATQPMKDNLKDTETCRSCQGLGMVGSPDYSFPIYPWAPPQYPPTWPTIWSSTSG